MKGVFPILLTVGIVFSSIVSRSGAQVDQEAVPGFSYEDDIVPIFKQHCLDCHSGESPPGGLSLDTIQSVINGGDSGAVLVAGKANQSYLFHLVKRGEMPPQKNEQLSEKEIQIIQQWIAGGLPAKTPYEIPEIRDSITDHDRQHWAFKRFQKSSWDAPSSLPVGTNFIDFFVQRALAKRQLQMAPPAARGTLLRRLFLDLIGIPPSPQQLDEFLADERGDAYERRVDQLLASPQFGPRWGRYWLDVTGYADTVGFDHVPTHILVAEGKWRYRDYVIDAFNSDVSYTTFVQEQLAGDELVPWQTANPYTPEIVRSLVATGFLRTARDQTHEAVGVITPNFYDVLHDTTEIMVGGLLGISIKCARCHDHKFDAFTQSDYYRIQACLMPSYNPTAWQAVFPHVENKKHVRDRSLPDVSGKRRQEINAHNAQVNRQIAEQDKQKKQLQEAVRQRLVQEKLLLIPEPIRQDLAVAIELEKDERDSVQADLVEKFESQLEVQPEAIDQALNDQERMKLDEIDHQIVLLKSQLQSWGTIQAIYEIGEIPTTFVLKRGQFEYPSRPVEPGFLGVLCDSPDDVLMTVPAVANGSSGRRLGFAQWLTQPDSRASALLARVMVNRVWQHLFGQGIVETSADFGVQGTPPTHPELLESLCIEFQENDWRIKPLIRAIVTSAVYRQTSYVDPVVAERATRVDPANKLYWRMPLRRLESEAIRDSLLAIAGRIDFSLGGPPVMLAAQPDGRISVNKSKLSQPSDAWKRSVYLLARRAYHLTLLDVFDQPRIETTCSRRQINAVALQSLSMLNDQFVYDQAEHLARQIAHSHSDDTQRQISQIYRRILCRLPDDQELELCQRTLSEIQNDDQLDNVMALTEICHTLLNTSEFLYRE